MVWTTQQYKCTITPCCQNKSSLKVQCQLYRYKPFSRANKSNWLKNRAGVIKEQPGGQ